MNIRDDNLWFDSACSCEVDDITKQTLEATIICQNLVCSNVRSRAVHP